MTAPWTTASIIPARCTDIEFMRGLGISHSTFYRLKAKGTFRALELPMPGANTQYSGALILRWLAGEPVAIQAGRPFFGKKSAQVLAMPARRGRRPGRPRKSVSLGAAVHASTVTTAVEVDESTSYGSTGGGR